MKETFMIVGMGGRGLPTFAKGLLEWPEKSFPGFMEKGRLVSLMDTNIERCKNCMEELEKRPIPYDLPIYDDLEKAIAETGPKWAIICVPDRTHTEVCLKCLEMGVNLWVEKPLATSAWECDLILDKAREKGLTVRVAHNYRHYRWIAKTKQLVDEGRIGKVLSFRAGEILGDSHGGDYFHRWHSDFAMSASMMNHKSCHHFDLIFWILNDRPVCASAMGSRKFYTPRPELNHGERCSECGLFETCPHAINMDAWDGIYRKMYIDAEHVDGYIRDKCVFSDRHTIYDNYTVNLQTEGGIIGNYVLSNYGPREYVFFEFVGEKGSIECYQDTLNKKEGLRVITSEVGVQDQILKTRVKAEDIEFDDEGGMHGHGGSDIRMLASFLGYKKAAHIDPSILATGEEAKEAIVAADLANRSLARKGVPVWRDEIGEDFPPAPPQPSWCD